MPFPIHIATSEAVVLADQVATLFGKGYTLLGAETVRVTRGATSLLTLPVRICSHVDLRLDVSDLALVGSAPVRLTGPRGSLTVSTILPLQRKLVRPSAMLRTGRGLRDGEQVAVKAGSAIFGQVIVAAGDTDKLVLPRTDALVAGVQAGDEAALFDTDVWDSAPPTDNSGAVVQRKLVTENDVRRARLKREKIAVQPGQILTPAARSLGMELGVLVFDTNG